MKELNLYQIDAFADQAFTGNPAAVIPLEHWLDDATMQAIAEENNLSETAFFVPEHGDYRIRWFTPNEEVELCGHATLASAYVLFNELNEQGDSINFHSLSGPLKVNRRGDLLTLDFPCQAPIKTEAPEALIQGLGTSAFECYKSEDYIAVLPKEEDVLTVKADFNQLMKLDLRGVIITAPSKHYDFVSRFFAPNCDIPEDPVTGSAYTQLTPLWADKFNKTELRAKQVSRRGGELHCQLRGDRVLISGKAVKFMTGTIYLNGDKKL